MVLSEIISPLIWWLILVCAAPALADVHLAGNYTGDGIYSSYSGGTSHKLAAGGMGPIEHYISIDLSDSRNSSAFQGLNASQDAFFDARTPEYSLSVRNAKDFYGTADLQRESTIETTEEIITEVTNDSLVQVTETVYSDAAVDVSITGNGNISEDIDISYAGKARALKLRELDGSGNFSLETDLRLSGQQVKRDFGVLSEPEALDKTIPATDPETGVGPMGGI